MRATLKRVWSFLTTSFALVLGTVVMVASAVSGYHSMALAMMLLAVVTAPRLHVKGWPYPK